MAKPKMKYSRARDNTHYTDMGKKYLAVRMNDGQERKELKGHVGLVHTPILSQSTKADKKGRVKNKITKYYQGER